MTPKTSLTEIVKEANIFMIKRQVYRNMTFFLSEPAHFHVSLYFNATTSNMSHVKTFCRINIFMSLTLQLKFLTEIKTGKYFLMFNAFFKNIFFI